MEIREARIDDNEALIALQARIEFGSSVVFRRIIREDFFNRSKSHETGRVFVACEGETIVGSAAVAVRDGEFGGKVRRIGYYYQLFVAPEHRRKGVARALSEERRRHVESQNADICYLVTEEASPTVKGLVESEGFTRHRGLINRGRIMTERVEVSGAGTVREYQESDVEALTALINATWAGHDLFEFLSPESLRERIARFRGVGLDRMILLEVDGEIVASLGVGNRSHNESLRVVSVDPELKDSAAWVPEPGQDLPPALGFGLIGYRDTSALRTLFQIFNNELVGQGPIYGFLIYDDSEDPVPGMDDFFQLGGGTDLYMLALNDEIELADAPVFVDPLEIL